MIKFIRKMLNRYKHYRMCKLNGFRCPDCIYHDFIYEGCIFRGNRCRYMKGVER